MRFEWRPKKTCHKNLLWGKNVQEIWVGTVAQAPSDLKPILWRLYKNEIRTADPIGLGAWYLKKKELTKEKKELLKTKRKERRWFWSLDDNHVLYPFLYTPTFLPMMPWPGTQALVVSRADKIVISALFASSLIGNNIFETPLLLLGISVNLPWGGYGYFLELHLRGNKVTKEIIGSQHRKFTIIFTRLLNQRLRPRPH